MGFVQCGDGFMNLSSHVEANEVMFAPENSSLECIKFYVYLLASLISFTRSSNWEEFMSQVFPLPSEFFD